MRFLLFFPLLNVFWGFIKIKGLSIKCVIYNIDLTVTCLPPYIYQTTNLSWLHHLIKICHKMYHTVRLPGHYFHFSWFPHGLILGTHVPAAGLGSASALPGHRADMMWGRAGGWGACPAGLHATICFTLMEINKWTGLCLCEANYVWAVRREWEGWMDKLRTKPLCACDSKRGRERFGV